MQTLLSGSSGLIGSALYRDLGRERHRVIRLLRKQPRTLDSYQDRNSRFWDPDEGSLDQAAFEGVEAVVHLGGTTIGTLWTRAKKQQIRNSRVRSTRLLADHMAQLPMRPSVFVHASAVGYYGDRGDEILTERSAAGTGFLADLCRDWEAASAPARDAGVRVVHVRTGLVLSAHGGVLQAMLPAFRLGLGGRLGSGRQWMPWITLEDVVDVYVRALTDDALRGAVNAVAPKPVTNAEFTRTLGRAIHRPTLFPVPAFVLHMLPGKMADEALLASERVVPEVLRNAGFKYRHPALPEALAAALT